MCLSKKRKPAPAPKQVSNPQQNYWGWWNMPQLPEDDSEKYRLNKKSLATPTDISSGTTKLQVPLISTRRSASSSNTSNNKRPSSLGL